MASPYPRSGKHIAHHAAPSALSRILSFLPELGRRACILYIVVVLALLAFVNANVQYYQQYGLAPYNLVLVNFHPKCNAP